MNKLQAQELFTSGQFSTGESDVATELPKQVWFEDRQTPLAASPRTSDSIDNDHDGYTDEADEAFVKRIGFMTWLAWEPLNSVGWQQSRRIARSLLMQRAIQLAETPRINI